MLTQLKLMEFLQRIGAKARTEGRCYLTGGTSAVLIGWRDSTVDIDLKFDPEPEGVFEAIPQLKRDLSVNIELAAPDNFIPAVPGWKERSRLVGKFSRIEVFHYDFVGQALAKISRGHGRDIEDVKQMVRNGLLTSAAIRQGFEAIRPNLIRYPSLDEEAFSNKVETLLKVLENV